MDEFKGRWQALGGLAPDRLSSLRKVATIESVGSSTRIEGAKLTDEEVDRVLSGLGVHSFPSRDEQEVAGYAAAMELVFSSWAELTLTENHLKQLHGVLQTASPFDTPRLMEELVRWTNASLSAAAHHPLLVIGVFVVRLLAVHPLQDGNGRLARVLTTLLLIRAGYAYVPFSSLERVIEENKGEHYRALRRAQATLDRDESQLGEWLLFFLRCLVEQKNGLARKIERERLMVSLAPLDEQLLELVRGHGRLTVGEAATLTAANRNTLKLHLRQMVEARRLRLVGKGRAARYELG